MASRAPEGGGCPAAAAIATLPPTGPAHRPALPSTFVCALSGPRGRFTPTHAAAGLAGASALAVMEGGAWGPSVSPAIAVPHPLSPWGACPDPGSATPPLLLADRPREGPALPMLIDVAMADLDRGCGWSWLAVRQETRAGGKAQGWLMGLGPPDAALFHSPSPSWSVAFRAPPRAVPHSWLWRWAPGLLADGGFHHEHLAVCSMPALSVCRWFVADFALFRSFRPASRCWFPARRLIVRACSLTLLTRGLAFPHTLGLSALYCVSCACEHVLPWAMGLVLVAPLDCVCA